MVTCEGSRPTSAEQRLKELGIKLRFRLSHSALRGSAADGESAFPERNASHGRPRSEIYGRVGAKLDVEAGRNAAHLAALNVIAVATSIRDPSTKWRGLPGSACRWPPSEMSAICRKPKVADAASELLQDIFGENKDPCRLVYGVTNLPLGTPVELEVIFEVSA
jgi:hypothetical protein